MALPVLRQLFPAPRGIKATQEPHLLFPALPEQTLLCRGQRVILVIKVYRVFRALHQQYPAQKGIPETLEAKEYKVFRGYKV
jgi:hypothetical protein